MAAVSSLGLPASWQPARMQRSQFWMTAHVENDYCD